MDPTSLIKQTEPDPEPEELSLIERLTALVAEGLEAFFSLPLIAVLVILNLFQLIDLNFLDIFF